MKKKTQSAGFGELESQLTPGALRLDTATRGGHSGDRWFASKLPDAVVLAHSTADVSATLKFASKHGVPVTPRGAGYGYVGGCVPSHGGIALSVFPMNRILEVNARDFVAVVQPGVITATLQAAARKKNLYYPPDPASMKDCSIGGNIATNAGGPRCLKYGVTRHYVLGLEVVLVDGTVVRVGGRTHKNKTGFDLIGMFVGSEGMLGVVTEATLRLLPRPPARATLSASFATARQSAAAVQRIFAAGYLPSAVEVADRLTLEAARRHLGVGLVPAGRAHLLVDLDGQEKSVRSEIRDLKRIVEEANALETKIAFGEIACELLWDLRRGFSASLKATGLIKLNEDIVVPRGRLVDLFRFAEKLQADTGIDVASFGHAGDGNIHVNLMVANYDRPEVKEIADRALDELFRQVVEWGGAITGEHGIGLAKKRWWPVAAPESLRDLHQTVKRALDPGNLLNPGKFLDP